MGRGCLPLIALLLLALAVAAHLFVYADGGAHLRGLLDAPGLSG